MILRFKIILAALATFALATPAFAKEASASPGEFALAAVAGVLLVIWAVASLFRKGSHKDDSRKDDAPDIDLAPTKKDPPPVSGMIRRDNEPPLPRAKAYNGHRRRGRAGQCGGGSGGSSCSSSPCGGGTCGSA